MGIQLSIFRKDFSAAKQGTIKTACSSYQYTVKAVKPFSRLQTAFQSHLLSSYSHQSKEQILCGLIRSYIYTVLEPLA